MNNLAVDGITYVLFPEEQIKKYVIDICEKEWDADDFPKYGNDLYQSTWKLEEIEIAKIFPNPTLMQSEFFQKDVQPRLQKQKELHLAKAPIFPLILRGKDLLIFDGYARYLLLKELEVKKCLAYVGHLQNRLIQG